MLLQKNCAAVCLVLSLAVFGFAAESLAEEDIASSRYDVVVYGGTAAASWDLYAREQPTCSWTFTNETHPLKCDETWSGNAVEFPLVPVEGNVHLVDSAGIFGATGKCIGLGILPDTAKSLIVKNSQNLNFDDCFTIEAWVLPKRLQGWNRLVLCWGKEPNHTFHFAFNQGILSLWIAQEDGSFAVCEGGNVLQDAIQHVVGVVKKNAQEPKKSELFVYLNGRKTASSTFDGTIRRCTDEVIGIGDSGTTFSHGSAFVGYIDEVAIHPYALSDEQVAGRFASPDRLEMISKHEEQKRIDAGKKLELIYEKLGNFGADELAYVERNPGRDIQQHYYANFGYCSIEPDHWFYGTGGTALKKLNLKTGETTVLLEDLSGGIRDPQVNYDGEKILFSYRKGGTNHYHLHEINIDGTQLVRLTDGEFDDIEPCYLPDGGIVFCSSRCRRYIGCWNAPTAVLFRCNGDGSEIQQLSSSSFAENTPTILPDGRILYTRWEYVNRDPVSFHHLWTMYPNGEKTTVYFGNQQPGGVFIDQKVIPGSNKIAFIWSGWHGQNEHSGDLVVLTPEVGPNDYSGLRWITPHGGGGPYRDPCPIAEDLFILAKGNTLVLRDSSGDEEEIVRASKMIHEPFFLRPRQREMVIANTMVEEEMIVDRESEAVSNESGRDFANIYITDVYKGRSSEGIPRGTIKKILVLEDLPKPANFHGGGSMPLGNGVTSTIKRILGTVPVEEDGSAYFSVPPMRSVYFALLDEHDRSVIQMRSYTTFQPNENTGCIGCHEERTIAPTLVAGNTVPLAMHKEANSITAITGVPDIIDYPRDVQPILDKHCAECHSDAARQGGLSLDGGRGPVFSISYYELFLKWQIHDTNKEPRHGSGQQPGNDRPFTTYSYASPLMKSIEREHYDVQLSDTEKNTIRLWIDTGAAYAGTYAAYGSGQIGGVWRNNDPIRELADKWITTKDCAESIERRCGDCHTSGQLPRHLTALTQTDPHGDFLAWMRPLSRYSRHRIYNLTHPSDSLMLRIALDKNAGGFADATLPSKELCQVVAEDKSKPPIPVNHSIVFQNEDDPDYRAILLHIKQGKERLDTIKRFDMQGFIPNKFYIQEMKRYQLLPDNFDPSAECVNTYELEKRYWEKVLSDHR